MSVKVNADVILVCVNTITCVNLAGAEQIALIPDLPCVQYSNDGLQGKGRSQCIMCPPLSGSRGFMFVTGCRYWYCVELGYEIKLYVANIPVAPNVLDRMLPWILPSKHVFSIGCACKICFLRLSLHLVDAVAFRRHPHTLYPF